MPRVTRSTSSSSSTTASGPSTTSPSPSSTAPSTAPSSSSPTASSTSASATTATPPIPSTASSSTSPTASSTSASVTTAALHGSPSTSAPTVSTMSTASSGSSVTPVSVSAPTGSAPSGFGSAPASAPAPAFVNVTTPAHGPDPALDVLTRLARLLGQQHHPSPNATRQPFADIPKFSGSMHDYIAWRENFVMAMIDRGIDMTDSAAIRAHDDAVLRAILQNIDPVNAQDLRRPGFGGADVWKALREKYQSRDRTVIRQLRHSLSQCRIKRDADIYLSEIQGFVSQLIERGEVLTEDDHIDFILHGLTPAYHEVESAVLNPMVSTSLQAVKQHVRILARQFQVAHSAVGINTIRDARNRRDSPRSRVRHPAGRPCPRCRQPGHGVVECHIPCGLCGRTGHSQRKCPATPRHSGSRSSDSSHASRISRVPVSGSGSAPTSSTSSRTARPTRARAKHPRSTSSGINVIARTPAHSVSWLIDTGAQASVTPLRDILLDYEPLQPSTAHTLIGFSAETIRAAGRGIAVIHQGDAVMKVPVYHVPEASTSILSVSCLEERGFRFGTHIGVGTMTLLGHGSVFLIRDWRLTPTDVPRRHIDHAPMSDIDSTADPVDDDDISSLPFVDDLSPSDCDSHSSDIDDDESTPSVFKEEEEFLQDDVDSSLMATLWHRRLAHQPTRALVSLSKHVIGLPTTFPACTMPCAPCALGKMKAAPSRSANARKTAAIGELFHIDTTEMPVRSLSGNRYVFVVLDDFSRFTWSFAMKSKSQAVAHLLPLVDKFHVAAIRTDNAPELCQGAMADGFIQRSVRVERIDPGIPQMNSRVESKIRDLTVLTRTLLFDAALPPPFWEFAWDAATYIKNRSMTKAIGLKVTPFEAFFGKPPEIGHLRVFGCSARVHVHRDARASKLSAVSRPAVFVGYTTNNFQYRFWLPSTRRVVLSRSATFSEDVPGGTLLPPDLPLAPVYRIRREDIPVSFEAAMNDPEQWKPAIDSELDSLSSLDTWTPVPFDRRSMKPLPTKWVFDIKGDGRRKARLVACGNKQTRGVNFELTYSPTATGGAFRALLGIAVSTGWLLAHIDIKCAYLNAPLTETDVFLFPPQGVNVPSGFVLRLNKAIYGLKQAGREWYLELSRALCAFGFVPLALDACVFTHPSHDCVVIVYVDDILVAYAEEECLATLCAFLRGRYDISCATASCYLGVSINRTDSSIFIQQESALDRLIASSGLNNCKRLSTPAEILRLTPASSEEERVDMTFYRSIVGQIGHLACTTRPDIALAYGQLAAFQVDPGKTHSRAARRVIRFLCSTRDWSLRFEPTELKLHAYVDADFAGSHDRKSTTGYLIYLGSNILSWRSSKQRIVTLSTAESEYVALSECAREVVVWRTFFSQLGFPQPAPTTIRIDSQAAKAIAEGEHINRRSKHIDIRFHFVRSLIKESLIALEYVRSDENVADILTKPLVASTFQRHAQSLFDSKA